MHRPISFLEEIKRAVCLLFSIEFIHTLRSGVFFPRPNIKFGGQREVVIETTSRLKIWTVFEN